MADTVTYLQTVDSTNNYAMARVHAGLAIHGDVVVAHAQTAGKGQRGKNWRTNPGENLILTMVVEPRLVLSQQFILSMATALASLRAFKHYFNDAMAIKWPNDIYWNDRKAGGILIENVIRSNDWLFAVVGIGLNINQVLFEVDGIQPVSLKQLTGKDFNTREVARRLCAYFQEELDALQHDPEDIVTRYNEHLYKKGVTVNLRHNNIISAAMINEVNRFGELVTFSGTEKTYKMGEVEWVSERGK